MSICKILGGSLFGSMIKFLPKFLLYLLNHHKTTENLSHQSYGMRMPRVSEKHFENVFVNLPPIPVQKQIIAKLDAFFREYDILKEKKLLCINILQWLVI